MPSLSTCFTTLLTLTLLPSALAAPAHLEERQVSSSNCTVTPYPTKSQGYPYVCDAKGTLKKPNPLGDFKDDSYDLCLQRCFRQPGCVSVQYETASKTCTIMHSVANKMGFKPNKKSNVIQTDLSCYYLTGDCELANGSFEEHPISVHKSDYSAPWAIGSFDGVGSVKVVKSPFGPNGVTTPYGKRFLNMNSTAGDILFAEQYNSLEEGTTYTLSMSVIGLGAKDVPGDYNYILSFSYCTMPLMTIFEFAKTGAHEDSWTTLESTFTASNAGCTGKMPLLRIVEIYLNGHSDTQMPKGDKFYMALGVDNIKIERAVQ